MTIGNPNDTHVPRPTLPEPQRERWQPLRLGLVELFQYDSEEFWFRDGHLLLRGNNGTGKSKVLSLSLPFLFDANLRPSRIEPDGDSGKRMAWNLLMGTYPRRIGYSWIEFGRRTAEGETRYLTLGAGLSAVNGRTQVESWYFILEGADPGQDPRIGQDLWLTNDQRVVLTRERLRELVEGQGRGRVIENAHLYKRAVDERLFQLGPKRYDALMDTLIQLRQPQLSKKPDEASLSHALTEALPPLPPELLTDVAEALNQLEEDRTQLERTKQLERAIKHFEQRYRTYAGTLTRRQAKELRQAQTGFDKASEERNAAHDALEEARDQELQVIAAHAEAKQQQITARERQQTLQSDPANGDANRLSGAKSDAEGRQAEARAAAEQCGEAHQHVAREEERGAQSRGRYDAASQELASTRVACASDAAAAGLSGVLEDSPLTSLPPASLADLSADSHASALRSLRGAATERLANVRHLERRHADVASKQVALTGAHNTQRGALAELEEAAELRAAVDQAVETIGDELVRSWERHCEALDLLEVDAAEPLAQLADWVADVEGPNPMLSALSEAYQRAVLDLANRKAALQRRQAVLDEETAALLSEQRELSAGQDMVPPAPATRAPNAREGRSGAPFWQVVDFQPALGGAERAGLEAALEGSGLLDAWVAPDGLLTAADGTRLLDSAWVQRPPPSGTSLLDVLQPVVPVDNNVTSDVVADLLRGVATGAQDAGDDESWIGLDGRFRLGALAGAWQKGEAIYIGHTARARARTLRLEAIAQRLLQIEAELDRLKTHFADLDADHLQVQREWADAPRDDALRNAIQKAAGAEHQVLQARKRLDAIDAQCRDAEAAVLAAREVLQLDAADLQLPTEKESLQPLIESLDQFTQAIQHLARSVREWQSARADDFAQQERELDARKNLEQRTEAMVDASDRAAQATARYELLKSTIGAKVQTLLAELAAAQKKVGEADTKMEEVQNALQTAGETRAVAKTRADAADATLTDRISARSHAIDRLQHFAVSTLLASALPDMTIPDTSVPWTIDPALGLARRAEQALSHVPEDEAAWTRIQRQVSEDLTELQRALSALGHTATSEPNDWGFSVHVLYQNRSERPDTLSASLADDIAQRSELLSSKERQVLENHLQTEIAAEIQRLMRSADKQVDAINEELRKRPTSTGVRYRLQWQPLSQDEGAPMGLDAARERLLSSSSDMWSNEDRRAVGTMLQQQIEMERARSDSDVDAAASSMTDQLARALDYRRWHRFRVERQHRQGEAWRKLSGPASSGERALGLTVPLFAAISSFYGRGGSPLAPRLMLLDEAFAGIDDAARAHCMGLIHEFDLDFVITSEREWGCYAELPGVSICQLQRREGMDAVFVSRWAWDGRAKRREDDPDRRFPPA